MKFPPQPWSCWVFLAFGRCFKSDCQSRGLLRAEAECRMLSSGLPPVFLLLTALELSWSLSDEEKKIILDGHNLYRSQVSPPAMDMLKMTWDTELEAFAQAYAEKCIWDHNKERGRRGENLFAMAPILDLEFAVEDWNAEEKYYNFSTATCVPGQMCGHYTQVVWASTHQIGCGSKFCGKIDGLDTEDMYLLVCNYYPPGNMKGRKPYREGPSCSQCPQGRVCVNSLCEPIVEETTPASVTAKAKPSTPTTAQPEPSTTAQPEPSTTAQSEPSATSQPEPSATSQPEPSATSQPEPSTTSQPEPSTTSQPEPTTTPAKPEPTTTAQPEPTTTPAKPEPTPPVPTTTTAKPKPSTPVPPTTKPKPKTTIPATAKPEPPAMLPTTTTAEPKPAVPAATTAMAKPNPTMLPTTTPKPTTAAVTKPTSTPKPTTTTPAKPTPTTTTTTTKPTPTTTTSTTKPTPTTPKPMTTTTTAKPTPTPTTTTSTTKPTPTTPKPMTTTTTTKPTPTPTTPKPTTTTSTTKPTPTTMAKPTPTTPKPMTTTTTAKPTPTTPKPTTTSTTKPTPTTPKPITSTSATTPKPTTMAKPTPTTPKPMTTTTTAKPTPTTPTSPTATAKATPAVTTSARPKPTTTTPVPTTTAKTQPKTATTTKPEPTEPEPSPTEAAGLTLSFEPVVGLDQKASPEAEVGTGEPGSPLTTEDPTLLESMGTAFSPKPVPETNKGDKKDGKENSAFSSPAPSPGQIVPEIKLGFNKAELITPSKSVVFSPEEPTFLRLTSSSKEKKGQSPAFQTSLSGSQDTEEQEADSDMDQPTAGAPGTCLGLSLFLLPSVILVSLLL
ncbi:peptidase inhibitor 16 isoform X2 [Heliangelus exortis]|uniref:peptidase inhibitor 16 isoform X2 n=1 Tax=Heliangelus exortis TaxID=472823 RepID=UPI003A8CF0C6